MALILSIETATPTCSVALHKDGDLLGNQSLFIAQSHAGLLVPSIKSLVEYCGYRNNQIDAIAVSRGPGSYTGLRIGVSTAKGLCDALHIPLLAVNTLTAMAAGVSRYVKDSLLCPMIDARRMEVYCLISDTQLNMVQPTQPVIIDSESFNDILNDNHLYFFGSGASKCRSIIDHPNAHFIEQISPDASHVGTLAYEKYKKSEFEDVAYFTPFYLKEFRATKPKAK